MKRRNSKQKTLDKWDIHYGTFTMPPEFWTEYPHVPPQVVIVDDRTHTHQLCATKFNRVLGLSKLYDRYELRSGDTIKYTLDIENTALHLTCPRKPLLWLRRKKTFVCLLFVLTFVFCGCSGNKRPTMSPQTTEITGDLSEYFEVVEKEIIATEGRWSLWNVELRRTDMPFPWDESMTVARFNDTYSDGRAYCKVGFGLETFDKDGNLVDKRSATATGLLGPYSSNDILDLMKLQPGEIGIIRWDTDPAEDKAKGKLTFRITSACEIIEGRGQVTATTDWDKVLDAYENYVDRYIACLKRIASGDMDAMTQYAKLLEKAEELGEQLENASGSMTTKQVNRYTRINKKMLEAAANGFN